MPPLARCQISALADLADQLRYASKAALLRQIEAAESLATGLEPDENYPEEWIVYRITGHRPKSAQTTATHSGEAVLSDLSAFVERLCEAAQLEFDDAPPGSIDAEGLCERWTVSRKTVDRARRKGLIARRVRNERGRATLVFSPASIESYESRQGDAIERAGRFTRLGPDMEERILRRAARYRRVFHCTLNQAAVRLAARFDRSHQGIRELLERHDARERGKRGGRPIFDERPDRSARTKVVALELARRGTEPAEISARIFGPRTDKRRATRLIRQIRARLLRRLRLDGPVSPAFSRPDADEVLLAPDCLRTGLGRPGTTDMGELIRQIRECPPLDASAESARAVAHQYLRYRAKRMLEKLSETDPNPTRLDEIETRLRWAAMLRVELVRSQLGLLGVSIERTVGLPLERIPPHRLRPVLIIGLRSLGEAVDRFAPFHGGRLAGAISMRITRALTAAIEADSGPLAETRRRPATTMNIPDFAAMRPSVSWQAWLAPLPVLRDAIDRLDERDALIIARRTGYDGAAPETITRLAERLGTTRMHAARYERAAIREALRVTGERLPTV